MADRPEADRLSAIDSFRTESFLSAHVAACVVDEVRSSTGLLYPAGDTETWLQDRPDVIAACAQAAELDSSSKSIPTVAYNPQGGTATGVIDLGGTNVEYFTITPPGFEPGETAPVLLALPSRSEYVATSAEAINQVYLRGVERGWVVVVPLSLGGRGDGFDDRIDEVVPELVDWINGWVSPEGGRAHLIGIGNAGVSAFDVAAANAGVFASLTAYPGFMRSDIGRTAITDLSSIPVRLWVGEDDPGWLRDAQRTADQLAANGGDVQLTVVEGQGHTLFSGQSVALFDELERLRAS